MKSTRNKKKLASEAGFASLSRHRTASKFDQIKDSKITINGQNDNDKDKNLNPLGAMIEDERGSAGRRTERPPVEGFGALGS